jgi:PAS domain S-box-containing protein
MTLALVPNGRLVPRRAGLAADARVRTMLVALAVSAAYYLGARIGFAFRFRSLPTSLFWLPNATMFAVFVLTQPRRWWIYALAVLPAHLAVQIEHGTPAATMSLLFVTNLGDGALAAWIVRKFSDGRNRPLEGFANALVFLAAAIAAPLLVSFLDAGAVVLTGLNDDFGLIWRTRFRSNVLTNVIWVPVVATFAANARAWPRRVARARYVEAFLLVASLVVVGELVFGDPKLATDEISALLYLPLPLLLWAAFRFGIGGVSFSLLVFSFLVIWNAMRGHGPFAGAAPEAEILTIQVFLTLLAMPSLLLAGLLQEHRRSAARLADSEAQYRSIFESTSDGVLITDLTQAVAAANPAFYRLTGWSAGRLRATPPGRMFELAGREPFSAHLARAAAGEATARAHCAREDGAPALFEIKSRRFSYGGEPHVLSIIRDVTEREQAFRELEQRVAERTRPLATVIEVSKTLASTLELKPLLQIVLGELETLFGYTSATIFAREEDDADLTVLDYRGPLAAEQLAGLRLTPKDIGDCRSLVGGMLVVHDLQADTPEALDCRRAVPKPVKQLFPHTRSLMLVPLLTRERTLGLLRIDHREPGRYSTADGKLAVALASQVAIAIENAHLYDQARRLATLEERQRLARELHDSVTQTLCAMAMLGKILPQTWDRDAAEGRRSLEHLDTMTQAALAEMRTLLLELRPDTLFESNLGDLLRQLAEANRSHVAAPIEIDVDAAPLLPREVHLALYRVAQQALSNISKHASAPKVSVILRASAGSARLRVADDGVGFSPSEVPTDELGTAVMRERALAIGAALTIDSAPGRGTVVTVEWPNPEPTARVADLDADSDAPPFV